MNGIHTPYIIEYQNREFYKHVFDAGFTPNFGLREDRPIVIIGGGITAIQTATMYAKRKEKLKHSHPVYLLSRSRIKHSERDADPKWADINTVKQYDEMNLERRLKVFNQTKNKGTVPGYALAEAMSQSNLRHIQTLPTRAQFKSNRQGINIETREGEKISNAYIICATGFSPQSHDTSWIKNRASTFRPNSNVSENGYPNLNKDLSWGGIETQGISFVGELGLSRLGPFHTNIRGAQLAWQRMRQGRKKFFSWW